VVNVHPLKREDRLAAERAGSRCVPGENECTALHPPAAGSPSAHTFVTYALSLVGRAVSTRAAVQVLGGVLIRAADGRMDLSATDMEFSLRLSLGAQVNVAGSEDVHDLGRRYTQSRWLSRPRQRPHRRESTRPVATPQRRRISSGESGKTLTCTACDSAALKSGLERAPPSSSSRNCTTRSVRAAPCGSCHPVACSARRS
jgi:DNA polymerase III beta subunit, N-terminal domain